MSNSKTSQRARSKAERAAERRRQAQRKQNVTRIGLAAGVAVLVLIFVLAFSGSEVAEGTVETDSWDLPALDGSGRITLAQFEGKPTVAAFFASWCHICQQELPGFAQLESIVGDQVNFVGINTMNNGTGLGFANQVGIGSWPLARDVGGLDGRQLATNFGARGSPTTVLYSADGEIVDVTLGGMTAATLAQKIDEFFGVTG